jgi:hypothetical protein
MTEENQKTLISIRAWQTAFLIGIAALVATAYLFFGTAAASTITAIGVIVSLLNSLLSAPDAQQNPKEWVQSTVRRLLNVGTMLRIATTLTWLLCFSLWTVVGYSTIKDRRKATFIVHVQRAGGSPVSDALVTIVLFSGPKEAKKIQNGSYSFENVDTSAEKSGTIKIDVRSNDLHKIQEVPVPPKLPDSREFVATVTLPPGDAPLRISYHILKDRAIDLFLHNLWDAKWNSDLGVKTAVFPNATYQELVRLSKAFSGVGGALDNFEDTKKHITNAKLAGKLGPERFFVGTAGAELQARADASFFDLDWHAKYTGSPYDPTAFSDEHKRIERLMQKDGLVNFSFYKSGTIDDIAHFAKQFDGSYDYYTDGQDKTTLLRFYQEIAKRGVPEGLFPLSLYFVDTDNACGPENHHDWAVSLSLRGMRLKIAVIENVSNSTVKLGTFRVRENINLMNRIRSQESKEIRDLPQKERNLFVPEYLQPGEKLAVPMEMYLDIHNDLSDKDEGADLTSAPKKVFVESQKATLSKIEKAGVARSRLEYPQGKIISVPYPRLMDMLRPVPAPNAEEDILVGPTMTLDDVQIGDVRFEFRKFEAGNIDIVSNFEGWGSCPFVFTFVDRASEWVNEGHILTGHVGPAQESTDVKLLRHFDGTLAIRELESERSFINLVRIRAIASDGTARLLKPIGNSVPSANARPLELRKGQELKLRFKLPDDRRQKYYLLVRGYYQIDEP